MSSTAATALSGMTTAQASLQVAAANVAGLGNPSLRRRLTEAANAPSNAVTAQIAEAANAPTGETTQATDVVSMLQAKNAFLANLSVFRAADRMAGTLLDKAV